MAYKPSVLVQGPCSSRSGYGDHIRDLTRCLIESDRFEIKILDLRWGGCPRTMLNPDKYPENKIFFDRLLKEPKLDKQPDIHMQVSVPNEFAPVGKFSFSVTAGIETTLVSEPWVRGVNRMDLTIVPSQHAKNVFLNTLWKKTNNATQQVIEEIRVNKPIEVLFEGARTDIFKSVPFKKISKTIAEKLNRIPEWFNFLYVGHWLKGDLGEDRKNTGMLIKVFLETFKNMKNPPGLILKTSGATFSILDREEMLQKIRRIQNTVQGNLPNVYLLHGELTDEEMNGLYNHTKVKAHVSFTKGECWGRPLLEASLSSKPIIAPRWSGQADFLPKGLIVELPGKLTNIHPSAAWENVLLEQSQWFTCNYSYASQAMKQVFTQYNKFKLNAKKLAMMNSSRFSYEKMKKKFLEILDQYLPTFSQEVGVNLPTLTKVSDNPMEDKIELPKLKKITDSESPIQGSSENKNDDSKIELPKLKKVE